VLQDLGGFLCVLDLGLQCVDLHPGSQPWAHGSEIEFLHEDEVAVDTQQGLAVNVLLPKHIAMPLFHADVL
jgi:hypothetical protein